MNMNSTIILLDNMGPLNLTMRCWEVSLKYESPNVAF